MVQLKTMLTSADNSGARRLMCIQVMGGYKKIRPDRRYHYLRDQRSYAAFNGKKSEIVKARSGAHSQRDQAQGRIVYPV